MAETRGLPKIGDSAPDFEAVTTEVPDPGDCDHGFRIIR